MAGLRGFVKRLSQALRNIILAGMLLLSGYFGLPLLLDGGASAQALGISLHRLSAFRLSNYDQLTLSREAVKKIHEETQSKFSEELWQAMRFQIASNFKAAFAQWHSVDQSQFDAYVIDALQGMYADCRSQGLDFDTLAILLYYNGYESSVAAYDQDLFIETLRIQLTTAYRFYGRGSRDLNLGTFPLYLLGQKFLPLEYALRTDTPNITVGLWDREITASAREAVEAFGQERFKQWPGLYATLLSVAEAQENLFEEQGNLQERVREYVRRHGETLEDFWSGGVNADAAWHSIGISSDGIDPWYMLNDSPVMLIAMEEQQRVFNKGETLLFSEYGDQMVYQATREFFNALSTGTEPAWASLLDLPREKNEKAAYLLLMGSIGYEKFEKWMLNHTVGQARADFEAIQQQYHKLKERDQEMGDMILKGLKAYQPYEFDAELTGLLTVAWYKHNEALIKSSAFLAQLEEPERTFAVAQLILAGGREVPPVVMRIVRGFGRAPNVLGMGDYAEGLRYGILAKLTEGLTSIDALETRFRGATGDEGLSLEVIGALELTRISNRRSNLTDSVLRDFPLWNLEREVRSKPRKSEPY